MHRILKQELNSPSKFKEKFSKLVQNLNEIIKKDVEFNSEELGDLLLSACRSNEFTIIGQHNNKLFLDEKRLVVWLKEKLIPNTVILRLDEEDVIRLLLFCIEITYQMFAGGTRATVTQKGFRQRRRTFESILVDQFVGKLGEIMVKKFLEGNFPTKIELDWEITPQIERHRNDIMNAKKNISIKSSPALAGIWAEADLGYDYGITVKCLVPQPTILQFFIEVCGFSRLLDFANEKIPTSDKLFKGYLKVMRKRTKSYKCGEIQTDLKGIVCGYFKTSKYKPVKEGRTLPYLGEVREERYLVQIKELNYSKDDWTKFLREVGLLKKIT